MAVTLKADNRALVSNARYSYLSTNYSSAVATISVLNGSIFSADQYVLIGNFGSSSAEILKIRSVSGNDLTFKDESDVQTNTVQAHPESTRIYALPYNQVKFYYTATSTFDTLTTLATSNVSASEYFTAYTDGAHASGYGWFVFYNQESSAVSTNSNAIPYSGFSGATVKKTLDNFFSLLNNKELKLISMEDAMSWLNEGYSIARNELNLVNTEYNTSDEQTLAVTPGVAEYALPVDFSNLVYIRQTTSDAVGLDPISFAEVPKFLLYGSPKARYYLRGLYLGFVPTPAEATTYKYRYQTKVTDLDGYDDIIDLPDNGHYAVKDFMLYRAYQKLTNPNSSVYYKVFRDWLDRIKMSSVTRDKSTDSWGIADIANV